MIDVYRVHEVLHPLIKVLDIWSYYCECRHTNPYNFFFLKKQGFII